MSERIDSELVAVRSTWRWRERPKPGLLAHSDRGVQYASDHFQQRLAQFGIRGSMSRKANCWDNAPTESLIATIKKELVHRTTYTTREAARQSLFEYIEVFYNRQRRHSALDYQTPDAMHHANSGTEMRVEGARGEGPRLPRNQKQIVAQPLHLTPTTTNQCHFSWGSPRCNSSSSCFPSPPDL